MNKSQEVERLKAAIISDVDQDKDNLINRLILLEGMDSMTFFQSLIEFDPVTKYWVNKQLADTAGKGIRMLTSFRAKQSCAEFKFCPQCKESLIEYQIIDPYAVGLKCDNNHRYHIDFKQNEGYDVTLTVEKSDPVEMAKKWLTVERFRDNIHAQIAELLRKYVEMSNGKKEDDQKGLKNKYCPICSLSLKKFDQNDVWVLGLKCKNDHIFYERNGLTYKNAALKPDLDNKTFYFLVDGYLSQDNKIPFQILDIFRSIKH